MVSAVWLVLAGKRMNAALHKCMATLSRKAHKHPHLIFVSFLNKEGDLFVLSCLYAYSRLGLPNRVRIGPSKVRAPRRD